MNKSKIYISICSIILIIVMSSLIIKISTMENFEHSGTITMKWDSPKLLVTHYYFEINNNTELIIDSYDYHKYNIGDIYTWQSWNKPCVECGD